MAELWSVVHIAGEPVLGGLRQECSRCGYVLEDWTGRQVMAVVEPGQAAPVLPLWPVGAWVGVSGNAAFVIASERLDRATDRECRPVS